MQADKNVYITIQVSPYIESLHNTTLESQICVPNEARTLKIGSVCSMKIIHRRADILLVKLLHTIQGRASCYGHYTISCCILSIS